MPAMSATLRNFFLDAGKVVDRHSDYNSYDYWVKISTEFLIENQKLKTQNKMLRKRLSQVSLKLNVHPEGSFSDDQKTLRELEKIRNKS